MTKGNPKWEQFEREVQDLLDLRSTPGSGNQWHDVSDGRSKPEDSYRLMIDCKYTETKSYSLNGNVLSTWVNQAGELGYHFVLPVRLDGSVGRHKDWVAVQLHDYSELVDSIRILNGPQRRCGAIQEAVAKWSIHHQASFPCCRSNGHSGDHDNGEVEWS